MTKLEMVIDVLRDHPCLSGHEITGFINRKFGQIITAQSAAGTLRPLIAQGKVGKSNATGKMVYWLNGDIEV